MPGYPRPITDSGHTANASPKAADDRPAVVTRGLGKDFGDTIALTDLDLVIERGVVFGFLGPNGAGKTTLIRLLLDLIRPSRGRAEVFGFDVNSRSVEVRRRCGYLPGELRLPAGPTARQFLGHLARLRGGVESGRPESLAGRLGLDLDRRIGDLSKGNRQKVGLVAALMADPELLILDEPTSGLDPIRQQDVKELVREHADGGGTVLLSSHALDEVEHVADRVGMVREGRLVALEDVADLLAQAVRQVDVVFDGPPPAALGDLDGVEVVQSGSSSLSLRVTGPMDDLVKTLAGATVLTLNSEPPELEQVFLSYYGADHGN
jgi:ABC-2 type transport system ATP-binding protein